MNTQILYLLLIAPALFILVILLFLVKKMITETNSDKNLQTDRTEFILMTPEQAQQLQDLAVEIWTEHFTPLIGEKQVAYMLELMYSLDQIKKDITGGLEYYFIMYNSDPCGFFGIKNQSDKLFLNRIYIRKEMRGKRIGKKALSFIVETARERQQTSVYLNCNKNNSDTLEFYKICGFEITGTRNSDIGEGYTMDDFILTKAL